jgi:hypothetical protein
MNPFKKLQHYFIGKALAGTDDVFEQVKAEVLFNFTAFFLITNVPYLFVAQKSAIHMAMGISVIASLFVVLFILRLRSDVRMATYFFLLVFAIQMSGHALINNGLLQAQGSLFALLFAASGFLLLDRRWGWGIGLAMLVLFITGTYNINSNLSLWAFPPELADPTEEGNLRYFALIPLALNMYLISEFVKARGKAESQLAERKRMIEEKQKEILDSIHYAKRIQRTLMPSEKYIARKLQR